MKLAQNVAEHNKIMLTRIRLSAKLPCQMSNLRLVSCLFLLSRTLLRNIFCISSSMKLDLKGKISQLYLRRIALTVLGPNFKVGFFRKKER